MIYSARKYEKNLPDINRELLDLKGDLDQKQARIALAKFLRYNIGVCVELISNIKLYPWQEIILKAWLSRSFTLNVWARGAGKSWLAAVFCFLQCIFYPNSKILIAGVTFRTSRFIFQNLENIINNRESILLQQAFCVKPSHKNDCWEYSINGGSIIATPLSGEKLRGFRASVLILDEFLLLPKDIVDTILTPFLISPQDLQERIKIRAMEDKLIKAGMLHPDNRVEFESTSKIIALSSASYSFENLYTVYNDYLNKIYSDEKHEATYFVSQISFEALPPEAVESTVIEMAQSGGLSNASFCREYCAQFTDESDNFYSAKKMFGVTVPNGESPTGAIFSKEPCVLAIDPSFSNSPSSDNFAMAVLELDIINRNSCLIHAYAQAGGDLRDHISYLFYILENFNIVYIICDQAGGRNFIDAANESELFKSFKVNLTFLDFDSTKEELEYDEQLRNVRIQYSLEQKKICAEQYFTAEFIRRGNELLQKAIDYNQIWFGSNVAAHSERLGEMMQHGRNIDLKFTPYDTLSDFIENQEVLIHQTKKECALIEVKATAKGTLSFDLPSNLKRNDQPNRARKDSYTALMLGNWAAKSYFDIMAQPKENIITGFIPIVIK